MAATAIRLEGLLAKTEVTYGTDAAPVAGTDGVRVSDRLFSSLSPRHVWPNHRENAANSTLMRLVPASPKGRYGELEIVWDARGAGAAYTDPTVLPEAAPLFKACGYSETVIASTSVEYQPADTNHDSCTIWGYGAGNVYKLVGCRGTFEIPLTAGGFTTVIFRMQGIMTADPAAAALPSITYDSPLPPNAVSIGLTIGSWSPGAYAASFMSNSTVERMDSMNASEGIAEFVVVAHDPIFRISARTDALATADPYADERARTTRAIDWTASGAGSFNDISLAIADARADNVTHGEQNAMAAWDPIEYLCLDASVLFD